MTDEQLAAIRTRHRETSRWLTPSVLSTDGIYAHMYEAQHDRAVLLAHVEELTARLTEAVNARGEAR